MAGFRDIVGSLRQGAQGTHVTTPGVVTVDVATRLLYVHDGVTPGGLPVITAGSTTSVAATLTAAGSTQGTATAVSATINVFTTVAAGTGAILPTVQNVVYTLINRGANALLVYPPSGAQIEGSSTNVAVSIPVNGTARFILTSPTKAYAY